jgi:hypothetical protein
MATPARSFPASRKNGRRLGAGAGVKLADEPALSLAEGNDAEVLVFDLA